MLNRIDWNRTVFDAETDLMQHWIARNRTVWHLTMSKTKPYLY